jgi:hypothetical protein
MRRICGRRNSSIRLVDAAWKLARADYFLAAMPGLNAVAPENGIDTARKVIAMAPDRAEGHFWLAANMGALAESFGLRAGFRYRNPSKTSSR